MSELNFLFIKVDFVFILSYFYWGKKTYITLHAITEAISVKQEKSGLNEKTDGLIFSCGHILGLPIFGQLSRLIGYCSKILLACWMLAIKVDWRSIQLKGPSRIKICCFVGFGNNKSTLDNYSDVFYCMH